MTGRILRGPWRPRQALPWPDCRPFAQLADADQIRLLAAMLADLRGCWLDFDPGERWWLLDQLPAVRPLRPEALDHQERARVADVAAVVLRRRGGWAT